MEKATPVQLRQSMDAAHALMHAGIRFICVPVFSDEDWDAYADISHRKMELAANQIKDKPPAQGGDKEIV